MECLTVCRLWETIGTSDFFFRVRGAFQRSARRDDLVNAFAKGPHDGYILTIKYGLDPSITKPKPVYLIVGPNPRDLFSLSLMKI